MLEDLRKSAKPAGDLKITEANSLIKYPYLKISISAPLPISYHLFRF